MKVCIIGQYHHKNKWALEQIITYFNWEKTSLKEADIVFSANMFIDVTKYPNKKFIFGPHFTVMPTGKVCSFNNIHKNAIYIQPSQWVVSFWSDFKYRTLPLYVFPFAVDINKFKCINAVRTDVFVYFKNRDPNDLQQIITKLKERGIKPHIFNYKARYNETIYLQTLQKCKYGVWIGCHESQGFALEEALSCNVPLLVWNVKSMSQEYGSSYDHIKSRATTIPYWSSECGEYFFEIEEFNDTYNKFISKLESYSPRQFIIDTLSVKQCSENLQIILKNNFKNNAD